jgi:hypothetical protein
MASGGAETVPVAPFAQKKSPATLTRSPEENLLFTRPLLNCLLRSNSGTYVPPEEAAKKVAIQAPDAWQEICQLHLKEWVTPGQRAKLEAEYDAGIASGKSWREIGAALGQTVKGWERGC